MNAIRWLLIFSITLSSSTHAQSIRVATYNLYWGNRQPEKVLDAIQTAKPDLVCMQETSVNMEKFLRNRLAKSHPYFHATGHKGEHLAERLTLLSRLELKDVTFVPPEVGIFGYQKAKLRFADQDVSVVNVHLAPISMKAQFGMGEAMRSLPSMEGTHELEIAHILKNSDVSRPTLIMGDFNSTSTFVVPRKLREHGFIDAFASVTKDADVHPTWLLANSSIPFALRIDYIFHSPDFKTVSSEVIWREGSDHSLVVAELKFSRKP